MVEKLPAAEAQAISETSLDDAILQAQGHRRELDRSFSWTGALGLAYSITNSWLGCGATLGTLLAFGGAQVAVGAVIISAVMQWIVQLGLAELCSAMPSSGGQYHFTYLLAPPSLRSFSAYTVGITTIVGWWAGTSSGLLYTAVSAFGIVKFWHPDFHHEAWHVYLCFLVVIGLSLLPIFTIPQRRVDYLTKTTGIMSLLGIIIIVILVPVMARNKLHPQTITQYRGISGWAPAPAWLMGITTGEYIYAAVGAVTHISEEIPQPGRMMPLILNSAMVLGVATAAPWMVVMMSSVQDMDAVQRAFVPSLEIYYQATGSKAVATFLQAYMTVLYYTCIPGSWITCSRITWAFARDVRIPQPYSSTNPMLSKATIQNGLPFSTYFSRIHPHYNIPMRTTILSASFCAVYGLVYIASTTAWDSIVNTAVLLLNITYTVPQCILAVGRRSSLPNRQFSLGWWGGYAVNWFSLVWLVVSGVLMLFPTRWPPTKGNMNYGSVVIAGIFVVIILLWVVDRRKKFAGPKIDWEALNAKNAIR
ncbi:putative choline transport protein [Aspergillus candidus]|uniref:Putative choline transport protein n=1 Tax=Aspergillus candidus TaxID=41067 RepID=A0A2I2FIM5_ASPCN|nr:putative choline transport protein [Aspergillus candidus]PLB40464.1 putative choline transport protein [Aspergillus candidus]